MTSSYGSQALDFGPDIENGTASRLGDDTRWTPPWQTTNRRSEAPTQDRADLLARIIEGEVIPRLFLAHRDVGEGSDSSVIDSEKLELPSDKGFANLALRGELGDLLAGVTTLLNQGVSPEKLCLDLLAPVARLMGTYWVEDEWTFADVTLGLGRLHQVLHEISHVSQTHRRQPVRSGRAYFAPVPGEQHTFGLAMVEDFFQRGGWATESNTTPTAAAILTRLSHQKFDLVGFSVGCIELIDPLSALIVETRKVSRNRDIHILVGGGLFQEQPSLIGRFEGVMFAPDGAEAVRLADKLLPHHMGETSRVLM